MSHRFQYPIFFPNDPIYFGPGLWLTLHAEALEADQTGQTSNYLQTLNNILNYLPCKECKIHANDYVNKYPPNQWISFRRGHPSQLFEWSWRFHNTVNQRLGKPLITLNQAREIFSKLKSTGICGVGCHS